MTVTVTPRTSGLSIDRDKPDPVIHTDGVATLVDGRGQLFVLDTAELGDLADVPELNAALVRHTIASYADGEWSRTVTDRDSNGDTATRKPLA